MSFPPPPPKTSLALLAPEAVIVCLLLNYLTRNFLRPHNIPSRLSFSKDIVVMTRGRFEGVRLFRTQPRFCW